MRKKNQIAWWTRLNQPKFWRGQAGRWEFVIETQEAGEKTEDIDVR